MAVGWVSIHREIFDHWTWKDKPFSQGQAWIDLIMKANHEAGSVMIKGTVYNLNRGQQARSVLTLSSEWGWSRGKVERFLKVLKTEHQIEHQTDNKTSIITICNYSKYQDRRAALDTALDTANGQVSIQHPSTNNKKQEIREIKDQEIIVEDIPAPPLEPKKKKPKFKFDENHKLLAAKIYVCAKKISPSLPEPNIAAWANEIRLMSETIPMDEIWRVFWWATNDGFWKSNILSPKKLRLQFPTLQVKSNQGGSHETGSGNAQQSKADHSAVGRVDANIAKIERAEREQAEKDCGTLATDDGDVWTQVGVKLQRIN